MSVYSASTECLQCVRWVSTVRLLSTVCSECLQCGYCLQCVYWVSKVRLLSVYSVCIECLQCVYCLQCELSVYSAYTVYSVYWVSTESLQCVLSVYSASTIYSERDGELCAKLCSENWKGMKNLEDLDLDESLILGVENWF